MRFKLPYLMLGLTTAAAPLVIVVAPPAVADCLDTGGVTVCSQGTVGAAGGEVSAGPEIPFDCPYDWYCEALVRTATPSRGEPRASRRAPIEPPRQC